MSRQNNTTQCKVGRRLDWTEKEDDDNSKPLDCLLKCPSKVEQKPAKSCCNAAFDQAKSHDRVAQQASRILSVTHTAEKKKTVLTSVSLHSQKIYCDSMYAP